MRTPIEQHNWEIQCYGCTSKYLREELTEQAELVGRDMLVMSMLSDAQYLMELDHVYAKNDVRQLLNRVKWVVSNFQPNKRDEYIQENHKATAAQIHEIMQG